MLLETPLQNVRSRVLLLRTLPFMQRVHPEDILLAAENSRARFFRENEGVPMVRGTERLLYIVVTGSLRVQNNGHTTTVGAGEGMGWFEALADVEPSTVTALADTRVLELSACFILRALEDNYSLWRSMIRGNAQHILDLRGGLPRAAHEEPSAASLEDSEDLMKDDSLVTRLTLFQNGPLDQASIDAAIAVARSMERVAFAREEEIFELGAPSRWWINMLGGSVLCSNETGTSLIEGEYTLGVFDVVAERPRSYRAVTKTPVSGYRIHHDAWASVLETHSDLALGILRLTSQMALRLSHAQPQLGS